jgi:hypothetical protein
MCPLADERPPAAVPTGTPVPAPTHRLRLPRLTGLRKERLEVLREIQTGSRLAASPLRQRYHFRIIGRDQKLSVDAAGPSELARCDSLASVRAIARPNRCRLYTL